MEGFAPITEEEHELLVAKCQENGWLKRGGYDWQDDPFMEEYPYEFSKAESIEDLPQRVRARELGHQAGFRLRGPRLHPAGQRRRRMVDLQALRRGMGRLRELELRSDIARPRGVRGRDATYASRDQGGVHIPALHGLEDTREAPEPRRQPREPSRRQQRSIPQLSTDKDPTTQDKPGNLEKGGMLCQATTGTTPARSSSTGC